MGAAKAQVETMNMCNGQLPSWAGAGNEVTDGERDRKCSKKSKTPHKQDAIAVFHLPGPWAPTEDSEFRLLESNRLFLVGFFFGTTFILFSLSESTRFPPPHFGNYSLSLGPSGNDVNTYPPGWRRGEGPTRTPEVGAATR